MSIDINGVRKIYFSPIKLEEDRQVAADETLKLISENAGICVNELAKLSKKCVNTLNVALYDLLGQNLILKRKRNKTGSPNRIALYAK